MKTFVTGEKKWANDGSSKIYIYGAILFAVSFLVYFIFTRLSPIPEPHSDALSYVSIAKSLASGTGFTIDGITPEVGRPPLFSAALGFWVYITGNTSISSMIIFEILLQSLGIWAAFLLLSRILSFKIAFWGSLFIALNPFLFTELAYILQEPMLLLVTTSAACMTIIWFKDQTYPKAALVGFFWGIATLGKIVTWFVPFIFWGMWLLSKRFTKLNWNLPWKTIIVITGMFILTIAPWTVRNYRQFNRFILVNEQGTNLLGYFFYDGGIFGKTEGSEYLRNLKQQNLPKEEFRKKILKYIVSHPRQTLSQQMHNVFAFTNFSREWFGHVAGLSMRWYVWIVPAIVFQLPLYIGLFAGLLYERRIEIIFLSLFYLIYWVQYSVCTLAIPRYAVPAYPILFALGLNGLLCLRARNRSRG